nr:hypothetical protein [Bacteroidota bacterium]
MQPGQTAPEDSDFSEIICANLSNQWRKKRIATDFTDDHRFLITWIGANGRDGNKFGVQLASVI